VIDAHLDALLEDFEARGAACSTVEDVRTVLLDFSRAIGLTGRVDQASVAMINGAVVPRDLWDAFGPRFTALKASLERKAQQLWREERAAIVARRRGTVEFYFEAGVTNMDTDEDLTDRSVLALCHGATEETYLEDSLDLAELPPVLRLPVQARVVYDDAEGTLDVVIAFAVEREPAEGEAQALGQRLHDALDRGWGNNYEFDVEGLGEDLRIFFRRPPRRYKFIAG
jgi:hypothetical protein